MNSPDKKPPTFMKLAHVLFTDIVGYSRLPIDEQAKVLTKLQEIVRDTAEVSRAQATNQLISIPTGDGLALVFFNDPMAPVQCAMEISRALKGAPEVRLRMGIHTGPVNEIVDVNDRVNVAGAGINLAQRVMDSGDAGHILLSRRVAEDLAQYSSWQPFLHDLNEIEVKHGVRVHVFNLYTGEVGNANPPGKFRRTRKRSFTLPIVAGVGSLIVVGLIAFVLFRNRQPAAQPLRPESQSITALQKKTDDWLAAIFTAQAAGGGLKGMPSGLDSTVEVWTTAQSLTAVLSSGKNVDTYVPQIKNAFGFIEKLRRTSPAEGWNYYGNSNPHTVTEVNAWVALAEIKSLDSKTTVWNETEKQDVLKRLLRDLEEVKRRQGPSGGWRPIREGGPDFERTYSTVLAIWSLVEAKASPSVRNAVGPRYDESIRGGINWLLSTYRERQGWVPNPNRTGQPGKFEGLTANALFVLDRAEDQPDFSFLKNHQTYRKAKLEFISNKHLVTKTADHDNSSVPDIDVGYPNTEFMGQGSTFLWFPWSLLVLTQLSQDETLVAAERNAAAGLRREILNANFDRFGNYVESAGLTYQMAENLFCVSLYLNSVNR